MNEGKVLLSIFSNNNIMYTIYANDKNTLSALAILEDGKSYFVKEENEIDWLNEIVANINKRYIRREEVLFEGEKITRFENKLNHFSYFAKLKDDGTFVECDYEEYKELYSKYNGLQTRVIRRNDNAYNANRRGNSSPYSSYNRPYNNSSYNTSPYNRGYSSYYGNARPSTYQQKKNGIAKKVIIAVAGVAVTAGITFAGWNFLLRDKLPEIEAVPGISSEMTSAEEIPSFRIEDVYDTVADTEAEEAVQRRYKNIEEQLREAGLLNWEIAQELDNIALFESGEDEIPINFYYDADKDEIVYVYEKILPEQEEETPPNVNTPISEKVQFIYDAINGNENLPEEFKKHVIDTYGPIWQKNEAYINEYELAARYRKLTLDFDYHEQGKELNSEYTTSDRAAGVYFHGARIISTPEEYEYDRNRVSSIEIYDSYSLEETLGKPKTTATLNHEVNHINGDFFYYEGSLLNEGYTQLSSVSDDFNRYKNEQLVSILFAETFGIETLKEGYYGFDLEQAIVNKVVEKTGRNSDSVRNEVSDFFDRTQSLLYDLDQYGYGERTAPNFEAFMNSLTDYYSAINGQDINKNQLVAATIDCLTGSHKANIYFSDDEKIIWLNEYDVDTGKVVYELGKSYTDVVYNDGLNRTSTNFSSMRKVELDDSNKYQPQILHVEDKDITYWSR